MEVASFQSVVEGVLCKGGSEVLEEHVLTVKISGLKGNRGQQQRVSVPRVQKGQVSRAEGLCLVSGGMPSIPGTK